MDHSGGCGGGEKEKDSGYICKVDLREFVDRWACEGKQQDKDDSKFFGPSSWRCVVAIKRDGEDWRNSWFWKVKSEMPMGMK